MKILTLVGTRPELIRLSIIIKKLDELVDHVLVYTNQNYDYDLSGVFFDELSIRKPNYYFDNKGYSLAGFLANAMVEFERILDVEKPDKLLVLGDTNSGLLSLLAERRKISIYHMEAGNRCYDKRLPEETNRRIIDHLSTYNLPYTENSKYHLLSEGFHRNNVFKTGNPIYEVLNFFGQEISSSDVLEKLDLTSQKFVLVTAHRAENVDDHESLSNIIIAINTISRQFKVIFSVHPRTKDKLKKSDLKLLDDVVLSKPFGFFDFVKLERNAKVVISDSGTVQEECCIFGVPSLTIRESTERHETIECGSNVLVGTRYENIVAAFNAVIKRRNRWVAPADYLIDDVSDIVINILLGKS
jgi:UDP-N-acetylglucosamine 2-epimerase (non-hydrolysing)